MAIKGQSENWYWEVTVSSLRYVKIGYTMKEEEVIGLVLPVTRINQTFGFAVDIQDKMYKIYSGEKLIVEMPTLDKYKLFPCVEIGTLQQVKFNFGKPNLPRPVKTRILSDMPCSSVKEDYTCDDKTFRQSVSLPFMLQEYNIDWDKSKDKKKGPTSPPDDSTNLSPTPSRKIRTKMKSLPSSPNRTRKRRVKSVKLDDSLLVGKSMKSSPNIPTVSNLSSEDIPLEYICPITKCLMEDPVILPDGHRYERKAIETWFLERGGNNTSPLTKIEFSLEDIKPDDDLKLQIKKWRRKCKKQSEVK